MLWTMNLTPAAAFAAVLEELRTRRNMSPAELARRLDVSPTQVSRWRRGTAAPSIQNVRDIATLFGVDALTLETLAGYVANPVAGEQDTTIDPVISALYDAEKAETHAALGGIPVRFHRAILDAMSQARTLAIQYAQAADLAAERRHAADEISLESLPDLAPPPAATPEKGRPSSHRPRGPLSGQYAYAVAH